MTESLDALLPTGATPAEPTCADVVCADPALLRLEFESIIAAAYPMSAEALDPRPPRRPPAGGTGYRPWPGHIHRSVPQSREHAGAGEPQPRPPRQRAPPAHRAPV